MQDFSCCNTMNGLLPLYLNNMKSLSEGGKNVWNCLFIPVLKGGLPKIFPDCSLYNFTHQVFVLFLFANMG